MLENKRFIAMFITAVCVLFLIKTRWPKKNSIYEVMCCGFLLDGKFLCLEPKHTFKEFEMKTNKHQEDSANAATMQRRQNLDRTGPDHGSDQGSNHKKKTKF